MIYSDRESGGIDRALVVVEAVIDGGVGFRLQLGICLKSGGGRWRRNFQGAGGNGEVI